MTLRVVWDGRGPLIQEDSRINAREELRQRCVDACTDAAAREALLADLDHLCLSARCNPEPFRVLLNKIGGGE